MNLRTNLTKVRYKVIVFQRNSDFVRETETVGFKYRTKIEKIVRNGLWSDYQLLSNKHRAYDHDELVTTAVHKHEYLVKCIFFFFFFYFFRKYKS